jgi:ABC-type oligopeptide transport system substrate-binding subunit
MNQSKAPFNDKNVRRAVQLAVDLDQYNKVVNNNLLGSPHQMFPSNYPYSDATLAFPEGDLAQAQKLIDAYVAQNGNGDVQFSYSYVTGKATADTAAQTLQKQLERLTHVKVTLKGESVNQYVADLVQRNFDANVFSYMGVDPETDWTEAVMSTGSRNFYGYGNPAVDAAITDSRATLDASARIRDLKNAQRLLIDDLLFFPLNRGAFFLAFKPAVKDVATFDDGGLLSDRVWIKSRG